MLGLEESALKVFVRQCIATVVGYHGFHRGDSADQIEKDIKTRIAMPDEVLLPQLIAEIEQDIKKSEDYKLREPLLNYCIDLFAMINPIIAKNELIDPTKAGQIKLAIEQFLLTMQNLYKINKDTEFKIHFNNKEYSLWGFQNTGARSYLSPYCQSGYIIETRFFKTFKFKSPTELVNKSSVEIALAEKEIKNTVKEMVDEFLLPLITARLKFTEESLAVAQTSLTEKDSKINELEKQLEDFQDKTKALTSANTNLKAQLQTQAVTGTVFHNQIKTLEKTNQELQQQIADSKQTTAAPKVEPRVDLTGLRSMPGGFFSPIGVFGQSQLGIGTGLGFGLKLLNKDPTETRTLNLPEGEKTSSFTNG